MLRFVKIYLQGVYHCHPNPEQGISPDKNKDLNGGKTFIENYSALYQIYTPAVM